MERLVTDAEKLNKKFKATRDENGKVTLTFADIVDAIHIVQQDLGITGTSAEEASTTITGSLGSVKASWKDLLTAMGRGSGIDKSLDNFTQSVKKFGGNIKPTLEESLKGVTELVKELAPAIAEEVPKLIVEVAPTLISAGAEMVGALASGVFDALDKSHFDETAGKLTEKANEIIGNWDTESSATKFSDILNKVINAGFNITSTFDFKQAAEKLTNWCNNAVNNIDVQKLGETVSHAWKGAWDFIGTALEEIDWENVGNKISEFINSVDWVGILTSMFNAIGNLIKAMPELLKGVIEKLDFASAASFLAVLFAPKIVTSLASNLLTEFKTNKSARGILTSAGQEAGNTLGSGAGSTANSLGTSWASTFSIAIKAFLAGWSIGTWIYNTWKDEIDAAAEKLLDGTMLGQTIKFATGEQTAINATNEQRKTLEKTLQKYEDMGYKVNWNTKDVDAELNRLRGLQQDAMKAGKGITYSQAVANQQEARRNVNSAYDYKIYLDTGKIVGGTSAARGAQYNYTKKGYAT